MTGGDVVLGPFRLVAGDVVHLWLAPERPGAYERRAALTGPFGTLWPPLPDPEPAAAGVAVTD